MSTNLNEPEDAGIEDLRQDEQRQDGERQPRRDNVRDEEALDVPEDPTKGPGDIEVDPSRVGGDPAEDDM